MEIKIKIFKNTSQSFKFWNMLQVKILEIGNLINFRTEYGLFMKCDAMVIEPNIQEKHASPGSLSRLNITTVNRIFKLIKVYLPFKQGSAVIFYLCKIDEIIILTDLHYCNANMSCKD